MIGGGGVEILTSEGIEIIYFLTPTGANYSLQEIARGLQYPHN